VSRAGRDQTPAPRKFFLPKRGTPLSQTPRPTAPGRAAAAATNTEGPRFQSTPRFGSSSALRQTQQATRDIEDVEDVEDRVEESSLDEDVSNGEDEEDEGDGGPATGSMMKVREVRGDDIEMGSDSSSEGDSAPMQPSQDQNQDHEAREEDANVSERVTPEHDNDIGLRHEHSPLEYRQAKRRKLSVSSLPSQTPPALHDDAPFQAYGEEEGRGAVDDGDGMLSHPSDASDLDELNSPNTARRTTRPRQQEQEQPTFQAPPRFKPLDDEALEGAEGLPLAFSPQRRGPKYVVGGLAAELQGWLSEVKGWDGADAWTATRFRVVIEEVRPGRRMYLTRYRLPEAAGGEQGSDHQGEIRCSRLILAGEGKLTGLGRRADVQAGSVVEVSHPVWDIELDECTWTVACDWAVQ
jgi:hypothetical protein